MNVAGSNFENGGPFILRDGSPVSLTETSPCLVRKYFVEYLKQELLSASVQGLLQESNHPRAQKIIDQGVWADPLRALYCGTKWSSLYKQCLRLFFIYELLPVRD
eukprot:7198131-Pyramimonas_sp.AAC.1